MSWNFNFNSLSTFLLGVACLSFMTATAEAQQLKVNFQDQSQIVQDISMRSLSNGDDKYSGELLIQDTENPNLYHSVKWDITINGTNIGEIGEALIKTSQITVKVDPATSGKRSFTVEVNFPTFKYENIIFAGGGSVKTIANSDGAQVNCSDQPTGTNFYEPLVDGLPIVNPQCAAFYGGFAMSASGAGTLTSPFLISQTCQNQKAITVNETIGLKLRAKITPGDQVVANVGLISKAFSCKEDFNADHVIDFGDLGIMFAHWGPYQTGMCDLNEDGNVDGQDIGQFLSRYAGSCGD